MKNIPVYLAQEGTASLVLKEIPHRGIGYVLLRTIRRPEPLVEECAAFCRSCGAERVLVSRGPEPLEGLPHAYDILQLHIRRDALPPSERPFPLTPMTQDNDAIYQRTYNLCFRDVSGAATYERAQIDRIYREGQRALLALDGDGAVCGMGELHGNELAAVGLLPEYRGKGLSRALTLTLLSLCPGPEVTLSAASDNEAALALYDGLGFTVFGRESMWYEA